MINKRLIFSFKQKKVKKQGEMGNYGLLSVPGWTGNRG
jgi:hypothetical protein